MLAKLDVSEQDQMRRLLTACIASLTEPPRPDPPLMTRIPVTSACGASGGGASASSIQKGVNTVTTETTEETVRAYFAAYSDGRPDRFEEIVSADYIDYGHTPPGRGPKGARDDYENAVELAGGLIRYEIDALVARENTVAAAWTGRLPNGSEVRGLSLYVVADRQVAEVRHALIGELPEEFRQ